MSPTVLVTNVTFIVATMKTVQKVFVKIKELNVEYLLDVWLFITTYSILFY